MTQGHRASARPSGSSGTAPRSSSAARAPATRCRSGSSTSSRRSSTAEGRPRDLTTVRVVGIGDFADRGFSQLGLPGLQRRTIGSNIGNEPRLGALVEANELESYSFPQGVLSQLMREIAAGPAGPRDAGRAWARTSTRARPAASRTRARPRTSSRSSPCAAASGCCSTPSRSTSPSSAARPPTRTATSRWRARPSRARCSRWRWPPGTAAASSSPRSAQLATARQPPHARRQGPGRARRPRLRRPGPVADLHHPRLAVLRGRAAPAGPPEPPLPLDVRKIIARRSLLEFPPRRDLQPRVRDQPAHRPRRLGGGHHRPARADRRAGHLRRRAGRRQRGRRRVQLPGDDRPAVHVRLLRRRRPRHREPVVRRGRRRGQRQRPRLRGPGPRAGRLPEHQRPDRAGSTSSGR